MEIQEFKEKIEKADDKVKFFSNRENYQGVELNFKELLGIYALYLDDEQKRDLFDSDLIRSSEKTLKRLLLNSIKDESIIKEVLSDEDKIKDFDEYDLSNSLKRLSDNDKMEFIKNEDFIKKHNFSNFELAGIIGSLEKVKVENLLEDANYLINVCNLSDSDISELIKNNIPDDKKIEVISKFDIDNYYKKEILKDCNVEIKKEFLFSNKEYNSYNKKDLIRTFSSDEIVDFIKDEKKFLDENKIYPYDIIKSLNDEKQREVINNIEKTNLSLNEKREIFATLSDNVKESLNKDELANEYKSAMDIKFNEDGSVKLDLDKDVKDYEGLDRVLLFYPRNYDLKSRNKLMKICSVCKDARVEASIGEDDNLCSFDSTGKEYVEAETWIDSVYEKINPEYTDVQKLAIIDNEIGKKISYSPDFDTEVFNINSSRALWKIISSGYGVCNGIANIEQYMLKKVGVKSELISSGSHAFLKINDLEIEKEDNTKIKGNTILDPTWNLTPQKFGGKPELFCINYEEARKKDINPNGLDHNCHKNDELLSDANLMIDDATLRKIYKSVNLADKDGNFPIKSLYEESDKIDSFYKDDVFLNIDEQLKLLKRKFPDFAKFQNSTMQIVTNLLGTENIKSKVDNIVVKRVYDKADENKYPVLYLYAVSEEFGEKFYFADKENGDFVNLSYDDFTNKFECYESDLEKTNGIKPWDKDKEFIDEEIDLAASYGKAVADKGNVR